MYGLVKYNYYFSMEYKETKLFYNCIIYIYLKDIVANRTADTLPRQPSNQNQIETIGETSVKLQTAPKTICPTHCMPDFKFDRRDTGNMVRCNMCMCWHHWQCKNDNKSDFPGVWCCNQCRTVPSTLMSLSQMVINLCGTQT